MFSVGIPLAISLARGHDIQDKIKSARDIARFAIDNKKEVGEMMRYSRELKKVPNLNPNLHTAIFKGLSSIGRSEDKLVEESRKKLQFNKANSLFNSTPYSNQFVK